MYVYGDIHRHHHLRFQIAGLYFNSAEEALFMRPNELHIIVSLQAEGNVKQQVRYLFA